jgi:hypothetical protein
MNKLSLFAAAASLASMTDNGPYEYRMPDIPRMPRRDRLFGGMVRTVATDSKKPSRNGPCLCGSGKKQKICCGCRRDLP